MKALEILKEQYNMLSKDIDGVWIDPEKIDEAIKELEEYESDMHIITDDRRTLKDFVFTNCNECINRVNNRFTETCLNCKRYYGCYFEKRV